jgi:hypothetical protein
LAPTAKNGFNGRNFYYTWIQPESTRSLPGVDQERPGVYPGSTGVYQKSTRSLPRVHPKPNLSDPESTRTRSQPGTDHPEPTRSDPESTRSLTVVDRESTRSRHGVHPDSTRSVPKSTRILDGLDPESKRSGPESTRSRSVPGAKPARSGSTQRRTPERPVVQITTNNEESPVLWPRLIESTPEWIGVDWWKHQECCFGTFQLLLSFRTILWQVDTDNSICCDSCLRDNWGSSSIWRSTVSIFSSVRTLNRALPLNTATFSKYVKCVTIAKIKFNHEYLLFRSENHFHR